MTKEKALGKPFNGPEYAAMEDDIAGMIAVRRIRHLSAALIEAAEEIERYGTREDGKRCTYCDINIRPLAKKLRVSAGISSSTTPDKSQANFSRDDSGKRKVSGR
jgi:hypothetical protein